MNPNLQEDLKELNALLETVKNQSLNYLHSLPDRPTSSVFLAEENDRLREEVEILKKAAAYFARDMK